VNSHAVGNDPQRFLTVLVILDDDQIACMPLAHQVCSFEDGAAWRATRHVQNAEVIQ
jgi:hypothetical protein